MWIEDPQTIGRLKAYMTEKFTDADWLQILNIIYCWLTGNLNIFLISLKAYLHVYIYTSLKPTSKSSKNET